MNEPIVGLPPFVIAQLRQIQLKLNERTIGSPIPTLAVNDPIWMKGIPAK